MKKNAFIKSKLLLALVVALAVNFYCAVSSASGVSIGNGGEGLDCVNVTNVKVFDYAEARLTRGLQISLPSVAPDNFVDSAMGALDRLAKLDPVRALKYRHRIDSFIAESKILFGVSLSTIEDSNPIILPAHCKLVQVAVQKKPDFPDQGYYFLNGDYWERMDSVSRAGLALHEVIYREAIESGARTSELVRYFNASIASDRFEERFAKTYPEILKKMGLPFYTLHIDSVGKRFVFRAATEYALSADRNIANLNAICDSVYPGAHVVEQGMLKAMYPSLGASVKSWLANADGQSPELNLVAANSQGQSVDVQLLATDISIVSETSARVSPGLFCVSSLSDQ